MSAPCVEYRPVVDADGRVPITQRWTPGAFMAIKKWARMNALKAHSVDPRASTAPKTRAHVTSRSPISIGVKWQRR